MNTLPSITTESTSAADVAGGTEPALPALPDDGLIILPVRNMVLFPGTILPIAIKRELSVAAAQTALKSERPLGIFLQRDAAEDSPGPGGLHSVGTMAMVLRYITTEDDAHHLVCRGEQRVSIVEMLAGYPFLAARVRQIPEPLESSSAIEARFLQLKQRAAEALSLLPHASAEVIASVQRFTSPNLLADFVASVMDIKPEQKQRVLEAVDLVERLSLILDLLAHQIEVLKLSQEIDVRTKANMGEQHREYLLREQLKAIKAELGEDGGDNATELADLRKALNEAALPGEVQKQALKDVSRLERMSDNAAEYPMLRSYLEWLVELPWQAPDVEQIDIAEARRLLDEEHFGLEKIKTRIIEFLAVRKLNPTGRGPILCFVGPPGVGKTSLGQSVAKAVGRKFTRISLGGVHDEAEIRGHRRTYIGALPGNILQALKKVGTRGCVMMLDEIDKLSAGVHGAPAAALLEVLDPEQNATFRDNYLAHPFDLSAVLFIATANVLDTIPGPLLDRLEVMHLPGYTEEEKREIARRYLLPRQRGQNGLGEDNFAITDAALTAIIRDYTREAGVRTLERQIGAACRYAAVRIAEGASSKVEVGTQELAKILGPAKFENEVALRVCVPGVATGLAWTPVGGDILFIEVSKVPGNGKLILTGSLGEVMKESAQTALTLVKSRAVEYGIDTAAFEKCDVHIHVPAGAIPKDGPSAGVAIFIALFSLFTDRAVQVDTAMTGEISLRGLVLPVGGIKEKVLAAVRAGIRRVMLPARNRKDLDEVPAEAKARLEFVYLDNVDAATAAAIGATGSSIGEQDASGADESALFRPRPQAEPPRSTPPPA